jgi:hypothetical protein
MKSLLRAFSVLAIAFATAGCGEPERPNPVAVNPV